MTPATIVANATADGIVLALAPDGRLTFRGSRGATARWLPLLRQSKLAIVAHLQREVCHALSSADDWRAYYDERAGILEYDGGLSRSDAEARAFDCCVSEWLIQNQVRSDPGRCHWCSGSGGSAAVVPFGTGPHTWLHSACWPAWRDERMSAARAALVALGVAEEKGAMMPILKGGQCGEQAE